MSKVEVVQATDVSFADSQTPIVVLADDDVETIYVGEQGPPGPPGPQGPASTVPGPAGPPGNTILYGPSNPNSGAGRDGDFYINTTTHFMFGPKVSGAWPAGTSLIGPQGPQGIQGNMVRYGTVNPASGVGVNGDFYINTTTNFLFGPKAAGAWPAGVSLVGPQGIQGIQGATGAQGPQGDVGPQGPKGDQGIQGIQGIQGVQGVPGVDGNTVLYGTVDPVAGTGVNGNFYINTTTHYLFGPKAAGAWPAGTSLVGPQGPQGIQGAPGAGNPATVEPIIDGVAAVGVSTNFAREDHVHPSDVAARAVRFDAAQALTAAQQQQSRQNIYAAPFDALAYNGMQVNGGMEISQERGPSGTTINGSYIVDGWKVFLAGTMAVVAAQAAGTGFPGFQNFLQCNVNTAQASLGANDNTTFINYIEGYRCSRLAWGTANAQPLTLGFWTMHHRPGVYSGSVRNGTNTRSCAFTYVQNAADTPEYKTVTIPGDTAGAWLTTNGLGMQVGFAMAVGSGFAAPSTGAWLNGSYTGAAQVNGVAATSDIFRLSGLIVLPGNEAPSAPRSALIMRPYDLELLQCMRQLEYRRCLSGEFLAAGQTYAANAAMVSPWQFAVEKRANATMSLSAPGDFTFLNAGTTPCPGVTVNTFAGSTRGCWLNLTVGAPANLTIPSAATILTAANANAFFKADARF
jgi:collagen triple helix repeat protein